MSESTWTRRDLLTRMLWRGGPEEPSAPHPTAPIAPPSGLPGDAAPHGASELPRVIAWLQEPEPIRTRSTARAGRMPLHRPPGAIAEPDFLAHCTRCERCVQACAPGAIRLAPARFREAAGTPWIDAASQPCLMCESLPCIAACEPSALVLEGAGAMGTARVLELDCLNRLGTSCTTCLEHCPVPDAIALAGTLPVIDPGLCTGCGACFHACPAPSKAIALLPTAERAPRWSARLSSGS